MHPDDDSQTTLSKWPFILGDVLLVATALTIAILGDWQLTNWQVAACVAAVALGAALFVLPYVVEFQVRVREEREDRAADLRILRRHLSNAEQELAAVDARICALEEPSPEAQQPSAALTEIIDRKIAKLEADRSAQEEVIQSLQQDLQKLPTEATAGLDPLMLKPLEERLDALEARPTSAEQTPDAKAPRESSEASVSAPEEKMPVPVKKNAPQISRPKRSARERHGPEGSRLLQRAISEKGDNSSTAVSRIIGSKAQEKKQKTSPEEGNSKQVESAAEMDKGASDESLESTPEPPASVEEPGLEEEPMTPDTEAAAPSQEEPAEQQKEAESAAETPAENMDVLLEEAEVSSPISRTKAKKKDAALTASVFIGIGNKPYLRGSGGGLSWEEGVIMEFKEIGKWQWVAPSDLDEAVEVQIFRNDEDPDTFGRYTLEPGQKLDVTPVF